MWRAKRLGLPTAPQGAVGLPTALALCEARRLEHSNFAHLGAPGSLGGSVAAPRGRRWLQAHLHLSLNSIVISSLRWTTVLIINPKCLMFNGTCRLRTRENFLDETWIEIPSECTHIRYVFLPSRIDPEREYNRI